MTSIDSDRADGLCERVRRIIVAIPACFALVVGSPFSVHAQAPSAFRCAGAPPDSLHGVVRGLIVDDATGRGEPRRFVGIGPNCSATTDSSGRFELTSVPVGTYKVTVANPGLRRLLPLTVTVSASTPVDVTGRLRAIDRIQDCRELAECASILNGSPEAERLADADRLRESALRMMVGIVVAEGWHPGAFYACIDEPNADVWRSLAAVIPKLVPRSECSLPPPPPGKASGYITHTATGDRAVVFTVTVKSQIDDHATVVLSDYVGPRYGAGWTCEFKRENGAWIPQSCRMDWIS